MEQLVLASCGLGLAYCATPGAVNAEALRRGLAQGFWPALLVQLGSLIGDTLWAAIALTGTAFLVQNRSLQLVLGVAGGCFLLRLAWSALKDAWTVHTPEALPAQGRGAFLAGVFFSLTNPSALAFWLGLGGGVVATATTHPSPVTPYLFLGGFILGSLLWCGGSATLIAYGRRHTGHAFFRWVNALSGAVLGFFGVRTLWRALGLLRWWRVVIG
jgi:threonine/homoserine/homoserine lactone efflux protein